MDKNILNSLHIGDKVVVNGEVETVINIAETYIQIAEREIANGIISASEWVNAEKCEKVRA